VRLSSDNPDWNARFEKRLPHIFIGIVAFQDICHEIYMSHMLWGIQTAARLAGRARLSFGMATRKEQYRARNALIEHAEIEGADFLLMIDDDQTLHECPEMIEKFFALGKPFAGGLYWQRGGAYHPVVMKGFKGPFGKTKYRFLRPDEVPTEPTPVDVIGGGCNWFDMRMFERFKQPHWWPYPKEQVFLPNEDYGLDVDFCQKAREMGYECWLHPGIEVGHLAHDREVVTRETRPAQEQIERTQEWGQYVCGLAAAGL
jgi:hypothetical protein